MSGRFLQLLICFGFLFIILQCKTPMEHIDPVNKFHPNDPFKKTMVPSQFFNIDTKKDNVVEAENGTLIVVPKGCFKNAKGKIVEENVEIELAEAFAMKDMLLSNLMTTSNGELLETGGMIYLNVTANGEQLNISKENPLYVEIPTQKRISGMMAYKGERDENGNMNWVDPQPLETFLQPVDLDLLDFLPEGFENAVQMGMPYKGRTYADKELVDSLYYCLSFVNFFEITKYLEQVEYNEPYNNSNKRVVDGKYTEESYQYGNHVTGDSAVYDTLSKLCIDPAIIKTIKSGPYQNTLIATKEFEMRLQFIFKTCQNSILKIYINNLDKNLWELDSMAADAIRNLNPPYLEDSDVWRFDHWKSEMDSLSLVFRSFSNQELTNIKEADKYSQLLKGYYETRLSEVRAELEGAQRKFVASLQERQAVVKAVSDDYKTLLWKREKYRMEKYGFIWSQNGWINVDVGTIPKTWAPQRLEILVEQGKEYDQVYTYVIYTSLKSLYRLNTADNELFYVGNQDERVMNMPKKQAAIAISIAYKNEQSYLAVKEFKTGTSSLAMALTVSTKVEIQQTISKYDGYAEANRIDKDIGYMTFFAEEKKRQQELMSEKEFVGQLLMVACSCGFKTYGL
ncbi:MAG: hypothetical protein H6577_08425 [Lewinellaceae bacterium]|nr:hypothetical protein [Saprospiraceae bacterium]MCB9338141.1 hypothetical protein [Lewinellaceae bacterium]